MIRTLIVFVFALCQFVTLAPPTRSSGVGDGGRLAGEPYIQPGSEVRSLQPMKPAAGPYIQPTGLAVAPRIQAG